MITRKHLRMYRFNWGSADLVLREGTEAERQALADGTWKLIEALIQDCRALDAGTASPEAATALQAKIQRHTADDATRQLLRKLARDWPRIRPHLLIRIGQPVLGVLVLVVVGIPWLLLEEFRKR